MPQEIPVDHDAAGCRLALVVSQFSSDITERLLAGALKTLAEHGADVASIPLARVPGSLELAVTARQFAAGGGCDAVICLGCIIRGGTDHYDCVVAGTRQGIVDAALQTGVPVIFGVLTCEDRAQAEHRSTDAGKGNAGSSAALAAIQMANLMKRIDSK